MGRRDNCGLQGLYFGKGGGWGWVGVTASLGAMTLVPNIQHTNSVLAKLKIVDLKYLITAKY